MSEDSEDQATVEAQVLAIAMPRLEESAEKLRTNFMDKFGGFYEDAHKERLETLFREAGEAKLKALVQIDPDLARQWAQVAESKVRSIETLGLAAAIKGDAKAASLIKEAAMLVIDTLGDVAWGLISGISSALLSGVIGSVATKLIEGAATEIADTFQGNDQPN